MADTLSSKIYKERYSETLRNRSNVDHSRAKMSNYSATDITVGAGDELLIQVATLPANTILESIAVTVKTANGATLVATIGDASKNDFHAGTYNLNSATCQYKAASTNAFSAETAVYVIFGNSADVNCSVLDFEVALDFYYASTINDNAGLTA
jgi:hypothetical protein